MKYIRASLPILEMVFIAPVFILEFMFHTGALNAKRETVSQSHSLGFIAGIQPFDKNNTGTSQVSKSQLPDLAYITILTSGGDGINANGGVNSLTFPIRAAFYYPWFPETWTQKGIDPYTKYTPSLGYYDSSDEGIIRQQIDAMLYGNIQAGIAVWRGQGSATDHRFSFLLSAAAGTNFKWSVYYDEDPLGTPDPSILTADLTYIRDQYSNDPGYLHIDGRFVVFVYSGNRDGCTMVDRWKQANTVNAYIVLKSFSGYGSCTNQPDGWHQYSPTKAEDSLGQYSFTISPGYWKAGESPKLNRDLQTWQKGTSDMAASGADFQLIATYNDWGDGTAVESASQWNSSTGYGAYLDALHQVSTATLQTPQTITPVTTSASNNQDPIVFAAGDIADCSSSGDYQTAALMNNISATVITLGDNAYESGSLAQYNTCYAPSWGHLKAETHPSVGNHEYLTTGAAGYFQYFGAAAGDPTKGYYSYDIGAWHVVVLNANCTKIGGCDINSPQVQWLKADLAAHPTVCTLAYWHQPRFSSGEHGNNTKVSAFWQVLYQAGVDLVLNGHDHDYERFAPQDPTGKADPVNGIREFVVGTGGKNHRPIMTTIANSEVHNDKTWGVLELTLHAASYDWKFLPAAGGTFTDSGSGGCH